MLLERLFPFMGAKPQLKNVTPEKLETLSKAVKPKALAMGFKRAYIGLRDSGNYEPPSYDFNLILKAIDTDSYAKQAFLKYKDLFWKEGWTIVGENFDAVDYLYQRIAIFEESMGRPFNSFLADVADQWIKLGNAFVAKSYGSLDGVYNGLPERSVIGYYLIPTESIEIRRDIHNKPISYRQSVTENFLDSAKSPKWSADEVLHLYSDRKPGYAFGTPFIISALDDIDSLRRIEEDVMNLIHQELHPVYVMKVGTETVPARQEEIDSATEELEDMRTNGGIVTSERQNLNVLGAQSKALNAENYLNHFKERVAIGLGVFPHHLGMAGAGTNRAASERLDTALYDRVKTLQSEFEGFVRLNIFNEILREGGFNPLVPQFSKGESDVCYMKFREIDIDTQIKQENHIANKFNQNLIDHDEARGELGMATEVNPNLLQMTMTAQLQTAQQLTIAKNQPQQVAKADGSKGIAPPPKTSDGQNPSTGVVPNMPNPRRDTGNKVAPANQFGKRLSPNVKRSDDTQLNIIESVVELLSEFDEQLGENNNATEQEL